MTDAEKLFFAQMAIGVFSISPTGEIWRHKEPIGSVRGARARWKEIPMRRAETTQSRGHLRVQMTENGKKVMVYAHRVVWMYFNKSEIPDALEINHKDGNPKNNHPNNLELVTRKENTLHAGRVLKRLGKKEQRGEKNPSAKLTAQQVLEIRAIWEKREMSLSQIAAHYKVSVTTIQDICHRRTWKHLPEELIGA